MTPRNPDASEDGLEDDASIFSRKWVVVVSIVLALYVVSYFPAFSYMVRHPEHQRFSAVYRPIPLAIRHLMFDVWAAIDPAGFKSWTARPLLIRTGDGAMLEEDPNFHFQCFAGVDKNRGVKILPILAASLFVSAGFAIAQDSHWVAGYTTRDGTVVPGHYQTNPNGTTSDNWSTKGNVNPITGQPGYKNPYTPSTPYPRR